MCIRCDALLTIEHILLTCSGLIEIRERHFTAQSLRIFFQVISLENCCRFLKEIFLTDYKLSDNFCSYSVCHLPTFQVRI